MPRAPPFYGAMAQNGIMTINECRAREGLPPVAGGDVPRVQAQNVPITSAGITTRPAARRWGVGMIKTIDFALPPRALPTRAKVRGLRLDLLGNVDPAASVVEPGAHRRSVGARKSSRFIPMRCGNISKTSRSANGSTWLRMRRACG